MRTLFIIISFIVLSSTSNAKRIIQTPFFSAKTHSYVKITKIKLYDTATAIDFRVQYKPQRWIKVSSYDTFITSSEGGDSLYVRNASGIELNKKHWTPASGINEYTLYFPPLSKTVETIDFIEKEWKIFDIELIKQDHTPLIPEVLHGNWLQTDGSNEWVYGILEDKVIFDSKVWEDIQIESVKNKHQLTISDENEKHTLYITVKENGLLIGGGKDNAELFSKKRTYKANFTLDRDPEFTPSVFKQDSAIYRGYIDGYHPKMNETGMAYVDNIIKGETISHQVNIKPDGSFVCKFPIIYPQSIFIRMLNSSISVFIEPGQYVFQYIRMKDNSPPYKKFTAFMGPCSRVNADLMAMITINRYSRRKILKNILDMTADDFKAYCFNKMQSEQEAFSSFVKNHTVCQKAYHIKNLQIQYTAYEKILDYDMLRESAYRKKHDIPQSQGDIPLKTEELDPSYFDFLNTEELNNPISLVSGSSYNSLIDCIQYHKCMRKRFDLDLLSLFNKLGNRLHELDEADKQLYSKTKNCKNEECLRDVMANDSLAWKSFYEKHSNLLSEISLDLLDQKNRENLVKCFGVEEGLATDIMTAQLNCDYIQSRHKALSDYQLANIKSKIEDEFIGNYIIWYSENVARDIEQKLQANKFKTGYTINKTPDAKAEKVFEDIIKKYRGEVVFIDFWATWCGPCLKGIEKIKPLKASMAHKPVKFVYLTNQTSPEDTWSLLIPDIKGEHYRLNQDQWHFLRSKFNFSGIPHYVLVDKNGEVLRNFVNINPSNKELKQMLNENMEN